jgi:hypothetical protein
MHKVSTERFVIKQKTPPIIEQPQIAIGGIQDAPSALGMAKLKMKFAKSIGGKLFP